MVHSLEIKLSPADAADDGIIRKVALEAIGWPAKGEEATVKVKRRSLDARGSKPVFRLKVSVYISEQEPTPPSFIQSLRPLPSSAPRVIIVGAGPAGYFAALELLELGLKPIVVDRGKDVRSRRRDLRAIQQFGIVDPHSNYCFGEGGAGTYSDGKLYTRAHKRGSIEKVLQLLVAHGAKEEILFDAHPHIGSNKLPGIVMAIRETIINNGGEVLFDAAVTDFIMDNRRITGVVTADGREIEGHALILATGHSARDIYQLLHRKGIEIEAKSFALGVRIEHPQALIDEIQYKQNPRDKHLPASSYKLSCQVGGKGVYSFCMCPGGLIVPAATAPGEIVVNGMSMSRRDSAFANSGIVTSIDVEDLPPLLSGEEQVFAAMNFQQSVERKMFNAGDGSQKAPAQRLTDFVNGHISSTLGRTSYIPGLFAAPLHQLLPPFVYKRLKEGVRDFGKKMKGYYTEEAMVVAVESRTSAPVRIPRNPDTLMHDGCIGLFPAGEGAGYAGGIVSAAMDGQRVAAAVASFCKKDAIY